MDSEECSELKEVLECIHAALEMDSDDSEKDDTVLGLVAVAEMIAQPPKKCTRSRNRIWIKPWRTARHEKGSFKFLNNELLRNDLSSYQNYLRMDKTKFDFLLQLIESDIETRNTQMREAINAEEKLAVTLRFLATGESFTSLNYQTRLSTSLIAKVVPKVCTALWNRLKDIHVKVPSSSGEWEAIAREFAIKWQFPNCLGALDGKHIQFRSLRNDGAFYHNYKGTNSIVLLALVDASLRFIFIDVGCNGRVNDAGVLQRSQLRKVLDDELHFPQDAPIGSVGCLPYVIVADDAFPLQRHIMKPYPFHTNNEKKKIFNMRLSRARHVVEHAFGILSNRFRVFQTAMNLKVEAVEAITLASCALHNFLIGADENYIRTYRQPNNTVHTQTRLPDAPYNPRKGDAEKIRQNFAEYFVKEGQLDWQYNKL